ncbi:MAG TPA: hypothetical protein VM328_13970, partial [Fimbriimonadaceae bacterium]|nr:hypothetical protein [Fimbriimonadaceae bacterium]
GLPLVRSAPLGYTLAVDARGNVVYRAPLRELRAVRAELVLPREPQGFPGSTWFPWLCLAVTVLAPLSVRNQTQRGRTSQGPDSPS